MHASRHLACVATVCTDIILRKETSSGGGAPAGPPCLRGSCIGVDVTIVWERAIAHVAKNSFDLKLCAQ